MKKRRKTDRCLNCGLVFEVPDEFCPRCGQENHERIKSLRLFLTDSFKDVVDIDSRLYRSVVPFLFQPGRLTNEYILGRRKHYVQPIRLYLIFSFIYFFISSLEVNKLTNKTKLKGKLKNTTASDQARRKQDSIKINQLFFKNYKINPATLTDTLKKSQLTPSDSQMLAHLHTGFYEMYHRRKSKDSTRRVKRDSSRHFKRMQSYTKKIAKNRQKLAKATSDKARKSYQYQIDKYTKATAQHTTMYQLRVNQRCYKDSLSRFVSSPQDSLRFAKMLIECDFQLDSISQVQKSPGVNTENMGSKLLGIEIQKVTELASSGIKENAIMDSLGIEKTIIHRLIVHQSMRWANASAAQLIGYTVEKLPIVMFFVLPIFALLLKLLYIRRKRYYVEHIIFTLHIHSFAYLIFAISIVLLEALPNGTLYTIIGTFALLLLYSVLSFRNVYKQNYFKTLIKASMIGFTYSFVLLFTFTIGTLISLFFF